MGLRLSGEIGEVDPGGNAFTRCLFLLNLLFASPGGLASCPRYFRPLKTLPSYVFLAVYLKTGTFLPVRLRLLDWPGLLSECDLCQDRKGGWGGGTGTHATEEGLGGRWGSGALGEPSFLRHQRLPRPFHLHPPPRLDAGGTALAKGQPSFSQASDCVSGDASVHSGLEDLIGFSDVCCWRHTPL